MSTFRFQLFGKFVVQRDEKKVDGLEARKEQELLSYLIIHRNQPQPREALASLLWTNTSTEKSKKYLRQALWRLTSALHANLADNHPLLQIEHDWVQFNLHLDAWADVARFERAFALVNGVAGKDLDDFKVSVLKDAVDIYIGDLLEGWYQDWCLFERERFQNAHIYMLDKLVDHAIEHADYEAGRSYATRILNYDPASERTYRRLMRLLDHAGDRTGALRMYQRCVVALREELGVTPDRRTNQLYEKIRAGDVARRTNAPELDQLSNSADSLPDVIERLKRLHLILATVQNHMQRDISVIEQAFKTKSAK